MNRIITYIFLILLSVQSFAQKMPAAYYRALALIEQGNQSAAVPILDSAIQKASSLPDLYLLRAEAYFQNHQYDKVIIDLQQAELLKNGIASYPLARVYAMMGDTHNALMELKRHLTMPTKQTEASILLDSAFIILRSNAEWKKLWLNDWYSPYERLVADVEYQFSRKRWDDAIDLLNQRMSGRTVRHQLFALRGKAYYHLKSYRAAEADFSQAVKKNRRNHEYLAGHAKTLMALGKYNKAIVQLNRAIELSGGNPHYYIERGQAYAGTINYQSAIADIRHFLTLYPNCIDALELFALYSMDMGRNIDALFHYGKLIKLNPNEPSYYFNRGMIYIKSQNWEVAEKDFTQAISLDNKLVEAFMQRGLCYHRLGNKNAACNDWKEAQQLGKFQAQEFIYKYCR